MEERIGKVVLDYSKYPGEDYYCDGVVEDELLEIVQNCADTDYSREIEERRKWPVLYHLSHLRENIVEWLPLTGQDKVLEVGSGCGAITGAFSAKAGEVTCVDLSRKRSLINAWRHRECENVTIHVGNFKDIEPDLPADYTYICLIGVFEYGQSYIGGQTPYEDFLKILMKHLAPGGRIVIAIENKYGLKYFAGCQEDHLGEYFAGIQNYAGGGGVRTFGRNGLEQIFDACGAGPRQFYYPYPDYKFMTTLYSDKRLPVKGELSDNLRNFDRDRMQLFHEKNAFDGILEEGLFPVFSNSYLVVLGEELPVEYARYSNDRARQYQIRTQIEHDEKGKRLVRKSPLTEEAVSHIREMQASYEALKKRYEGSGLRVNPCVLQGKDACFAFEEGEPLSKLLDECLKQDATEGFLEYLQKMIMLVSYGQGDGITDTDLAFSNLMVAGDQWTLLDYEWVTREAVDIRYLLYRAVYCYILEDPFREGLPMKDVLELLNMTEEEAQWCREQEMGLQQQVTGGRRAMAQLREDIGYQVSKPVYWIQRSQAMAGKYEIQVYEDRGEGYREEASYFVKDAERVDQYASFALKVAGDVKNLRIDPMMDTCIVRIHSLHWNGEQIDAANKRLVVCNGRMSQAEHTGTPSVVFATQDPNINLRLERLERKEENELCVSLEIVTVSEEMAQDLRGKAGLFR